MLWRNTSKQACQYCVSCRAWESRITNNLTSPPMLFWLLRLLYHIQSCSLRAGGWQRPRGFLTLKQVPLIHPRTHNIIDMQNGMQKFSCSSEFQAEVTRFAYQFLLLLLIRQFVILSSPGRRSVTGPAGIHPPKRTLKEVTKSGLCAVPSTQCT